MTEGAANLDLANLRRQLAAVDARTEQIHSTVKTIVILNVYIIGLVAVIYLAARAKGGSS